MQHVTGCVYANAHMPLITQRLSQRETRSAKMFKVFYELFHQAAEAAQV